ncbi:MAG TPA: sugar phosphate nucleotidyltransferase [Aggregatilinea sp.]|uniref:sugar phosphate nucleotidyltransferase n=1 Tax=Aggregatilinea sp. TaxID=2806333 RepID=UPI002B7C11B0|nr:sugar phosphate nucleotidyltransferase [Aggregatilinea sp.]HML20186.1 sugar phosphate nucleotidyltransferase [Aggregatilinea sp.]
MIQQAVILAAGRGKRLGQLTKDRPKSMLPVLGKPIIARVMDRFRDAGVRRFVVVVGENDGQMASYLNQSWYPDADIRFVMQPVPTGTVDALLAAAPHLDGPFLLTAVDNLTSPAHISNLITRFHEHPDHLAVVSLLEGSPADIRKSSGVVLNNSRVEEIIEKPDQPRTSWLSFMLYAFAHDYLDFLPAVPVSPRGERELVSAIQAGIEQGRRVGYVIADWRLHLTRELDLYAINRQFLREGRDTHILSEIPDSVQITPPVRIDPNVSVGPGAEIGPNVYLESGATVGQRAVVKNAVLLRGGVIPAGEHCDGEIIGNGVRLVDPDSSHPAA